MTTEYSKIEVAQVNDALPILRLITNDLPSTEKLLQLNRKLQFIEDDSLTAENIFNGMNKLNCAVNEETENRNFFGRIADFFNAKIMAIQGKLFYNSLMKDLENAKKKGYTDIRFIIEYFSDIYPLTSTLINHKRITTLRVFMLACGIEENVKMESENAQKKLQ